MSTKRHRQKGGRYTPPQSGEHAAWCGVSMAMRDRTTGEVRLMHHGCDSKRCTSCGPRWAQENAEHYLARMTAEGEAVYRAPVTAERWALLRQRIKRAAGARYVRLPTPQGGFVVYCTAPVGEPLPAASVATALVSDFAAARTGQREPEPGVGPPTPRARRRHLGTAGGGGVTRRRRRPSCDTPGPWGPCTLPAGHDGDHQAELVGQRWTDEAIPVPPGGYRVGG